MFLARHCSVYTVCVWLASTFATHAVCGLYTIIVIVIGLVLSLSTAFTHQLGQESYYLEVNRLSADIMQYFNTSARLRLPRREC